MTKTYEIGPFWLDSAAGVLSYAGAPVALGPRAVAVLTTLVTRANEFVGKASIMDAAWPGVVVEEVNLAVQISAIRRVFAKVAGGERWIETLPKRGYRFVGPLAELRDELSRGGVSGIARSNLPAQLTSFVGRERELVEIKRLLPGKRLLTLVGTGGIGKTRLALQVAAEVMDAYRDGVWLVEFASITDASLIPRSIAQVLGVQETPGMPLSQTLGEHLKFRQLLLILDNCEHLLDACATLADILLRAAAEATIIATSREPLHVAGEQTYLLPALPLPDPTASADVMIRSEAVQLFVERAQRQRLDFEWNAARAPTIAQLCIHLDGIPLALELAAARIRTLSVEQITARIDDRFRLLTGGARTALPRQQTLRATLNWSYDLLRDAEKAMLCRVSVFSGGWTLEAAQQVCSREGIDVGEALDLLSSLADKSLAWAEDRNGTTRYRLLETVRQYAWERLRESDEEAQCQGRHLAYFLALAEEAEPQLTGADQQAWLDRLDTEHDNLRSALARASVPGGDTARGLLLAGGLWRFWEVRGYLSEGRGWLSGLLAAAPSGPAAARAKALNGAGALALQQGDYVAARAHHEEGLAIRRELGDRRGIAGSLNNLGIVASEQGDYVAAGALFEESLAIRRELGHKQPIAASLNNLGGVAYTRRDYPAAQALFKESLALCQELGDRQGIASALANLGEVSSAQGHNAFARAFFAESLAIFRELGDRWGIASSLEGLAYVALALAGPSRAANFWGAAERLREEIGAPLLQSGRSRHDGQVASARAAMGDDMGFGLAWQEGRAMTLEEALRYARERHDE